MSSKMTKNDRFTIEDAIYVVNKLSLFKDPKIIEFEIKPFSNEPLGYLSIQELLRVEACERNDNIGASKKTLTFFVKSKGHSAIDFDNLIFREESAFFNDVMLKMLENFKSEPWAAECYLVKDNSLFVLEDLRSKGFKAPNRSLELHEFKSAIATLARFHASSMLLEEKLKKPLDEAYPGLFKEKTFLKDNGSAWKWLTSGMEVVEKIAEDLGLDATKVSKAYNLILEKVLPTKDRRNVLCHLDLWFNNFMFDESGSRCRLVDFQMLSYTSYAVDLSFIIYLNAKVETRQKLEKELIELYHSVLTENLQLHNYKGKLITLDEVLRDFDEKKICGLVVAVQCLPIAMWGKEMAQKYSDPNTCLHYMYTSRIELVKKAMQQDDNYRSRMEEIVRDLLEYMEKL